MVRWPMGRQFYKSVVIIWLALSIVSVVLAAISWTRMPQRIAAVRQIQKIREALNETRHSLADAESGTRGYVISGDTNFLAPLNFAKTNLPVQFDQLVGLVHDDPIILDNVTEL